MSFSILRRADSYAPAFSPIQYLFDSDQKNQAGFRYTLSLFHGSTFLLNQRFDKRPVTGYGMVDLSPIMRSYIDQTEGLPFGIGGFQSAPSYAVSFSGSLGYEIATWQLTDNFYSDGMVGFTSATSQHSFQVSDEIDILQDSPATNPAYNGRHTVIAVPNSHSIITDQPFLESSGAEGGIARKANGEPMSFSGQSVFDQAWACGYSIPTEDLQSFDSQDYIIGHGGGYKKWITNAPRLLYRIPRDGQVFLPIKNTPDVAKLIVFTYLADNSVLGAYEIENQNANLKQVQWQWACVGPANLSALGPLDYTTTYGPTEIMNFSAASYAIGIDDPEGGPLMEYQQRFTIDDRCARPNESFTVCWMDKGGAFVSNSFPLKHEEKHRISRQTMGNGQFGRIEGDEINYYAQDAGQRTYVVDSFKELTLHTNSMTQSESDYFAREFFDSPFQYWLKDSTTPIPLIQENGTYERIQRINQEDEIRYEVTFSVAFRTNTPI